MIYLDHSFVWNCGDQPPIETFATAKVLRVPKGAIWVPVGVQHPAMGAVTIPPDMALRLQSFCWFDMPRTSLHGQLLPYSIAAFIPTASGFE